MDPSPTSDQQRAPPAYDITQGGHYGASANLAQSGFGASDFYTGTWANVSQGLHGQYKDILMTYWQQMIHHLENDTHDYKLHQLPLARIKKVMKADPEVKMISAEAPILFAKGCDIFITELTMRAWIHAEENKRRTLQRSDIASALAKSDMFDFLIDIVPREEMAARDKRASVAGSTTALPPGAPGQLPQQAGMPPPSAHPGQHPLSSEYAIGHGISSEHDYRQQPSIYTSQVQQQTAPYPGQQPMYGDMDGLYGYSQMPPQQQMYQVQQQRAHESSVGGESNHTYPRHGGEGEPDADGEHYEVG